MRNVIVSLITLLSLMSHFVVGAVSVTHIGTEPIGSAQIIGGATAGCEGIESFITVYYGHTDGGNNAQQWEKSFGQQQEIAPNGEFQIMVPGLSRSQLYYYRCHVSNAVGFAWAPESGQFSNTPGFTPSEVDAMAEAAQQAWVDEVWQQETNRSGKISLREFFDQDNWRVTTTGEWMQAYNGQILVPPWEFCKSEPFVYTNNTASNALRSRIRAGYMMDYETLNSLTDDKVIMERNKFYNQPTNIIMQLGQAMFPGLVGANHVAVLLVGHLEWEGYEYVYFLFRVSHAESPQEKEYVFSDMAFRKDSVNNLYWHTSDLNMSAISSFLTIAGPPSTTRSMNIGTYQMMYDHYKGSDVPEHFYTFGE